MTCIIGPADRHLLLIPPTTRRQRAKMHAAIQPHVFEAYHASKTRKTREKRERNSRVSTDHRIVREPAILMGHSLQNEPYSKLPDLSPATKLTPSLSKVRYGAALRCRGSLWPFLRPRPRLL